MQKAKPIEPGCKAMVLPCEDKLRGDLTGDIADVIKSFDGTYEDILRAWLINVDGELLICSEDLLMRIDDPDEEENIFDAVDLRESIDE